MICPECGERYNYYEPQCPWCGAAKLVEKEKSDEGAEPSGSQIENAPEKEVFFTYKARKKRDGKILLVCKYCIALFVFMVFVCMLGELFRQPITKNLLLTVFIPLAVSVVFFFDAGYSIKAVREIKCRKDDFVLYRLNDEAVLPFGKTDILKKRYRTGLFRHMYVFVIDKEIFFVDEHDFPEVAETMNKLYFGKD
jgi:ssDNA-binding Zn-finger/Zn-ribbon topoisomerase 1